MWREIKENNARVTFSADVGWNSGSTYRRQPHRHISTHLVRTEQNDRKVGSILAQVVAQACGGVLVCLYRWLEIALGTIRGHARGTDQPQLQLQLLMATHSNMRISVRRRVVVAFSII